MDKPKFDLGTKVLIKSANEEGTVTGWECKTDECGWWFTYDIRREVTSVYFDHEDETAKSRKNYVDYKAAEHELEEIKTESDAIDAIKYLMGSRSIAATGSDLNKLMEDLLFPGLKSVPKSSATCPHSWRSYVGLTQSYDFCEKCDEKKK